MNDLVYYDGNNDNYTILIELIIHCIVSATFFVLDEKRVKRRSYTHSTQIKSSKKLEPNHFICLGFLN